jgi:hypothetical protein
MMLAKNLQDGGAAASFPKALDGDRNQVRLIDQSVDIGKWPISSTVIWRSGR